LSAASARCREPTHLHAAQPRWLIYGRQTLLFCLSGSLLRFERFLVDATGLLVELIELLICLQQLLVDLFRSLVYLFAAGQAAAEVAVDAVG